MHYKITTLVENAVYGRNLQAEHGLSLLIENNGYKILFDTGQSDLFIRNVTPTCWIYPDSVLSPGRRNLFPDCSYSRTFRL